MAEEDGPLDQQTDKMPDQFPGRYVLGVKAILNRLVLNPIHYFLSAMALAAIRSTRPGEISFIHRPIFPLKEGMQKRSRFSMALIINSAHRSDVMIFPSCIFDHQKLRLTHSGRIHIEFTARGYIYVQNMALVTPIRDFATVDEIRKLVQGKKMDREGWDQIKSVFIDYILKEDKRFFSVPDLDQYKGQTCFRIELGHNWIIRR